MDRRTIDDPDLPLCELLRRWPEAVSVFLQHKTRCVGCLISPFHTVVDACREYDLDEVRFRGELRRAVTRRVPPTDEGGTQRSACVRFLRSRPFPRR